MDDVFLNELIKHGRGQFRKVGVPHGKVYELRYLHPVSIPVVKLFLPLCHGGFQHELTLSAVSGQNLM